ncbi:hypothetical protein F5X68DRAFT_258227 [Plectosphaerella plurivora]|uniref:Zn(2)-C6 fungal-type domain-containing protein n=1 Tax=Plectosphaerella plurivora TaxID=936078 RepID=A0A9P8VJZ2_9PEZI|nr:hypothetical protein F5X68DRAFT_258227 [Plectosphaerella plurivora]
MDPDQRHAQKTRFRTMAFPRKRAVTACETCRARKTKCDNVRPRCSKCVAGDLDCSYDPRLDHSSFDPASLLILEKLNEVSQKIDNIQATAPVSRPLPIQQPPPEVSPGTASAHTTPSARLEIVDTDDCLEVLAPFASLDYILTWPIFAGRWPFDLFSKEVYNRSFGSGKSPSDDSPQPTRGHQRQGISEEDVPDLIDRYLHFVYPKNPIFYTRELREHARRIAEDGFDWDAPSCLILVACALGAISCRFDPIHEAGHLVGRNSVDETATRRQMAEAYFLAARKRMGMLEPSLIASQCHMLSGIYLMYTFRQIQGWAAFHQAGSTLSMYLKGRAALEGHVGDNHGLPESADKRLEQRIYWTVLKSECEMRTELDVSQSDLCKIGYPYPFPSPPSPQSPSQTPQMPVHTPTPPHTTGASSQTFASTPSQSYQGIEEQSWFYYLSEIALRRIENRVLNTFYKEDHHSWTRTNVEDMISAAMTIEDQIELWQFSVPDPIRYDNLSSNQEYDELRLVTEGRERGIKDLLYRPFLYYAVHSTQTLSDATRKAVERLLHKGLESCLWFHSGIAMTHRHHGTWYGLRGCTISGLMMVAAQMKGFISWTEPLGDRDVPQVTSYALAMHNALEKLRYWEAESPDIVRARELMEELVAGIS